DGQGVRPGAELGRPLNVLPWLLRVEVPGRRQAALDEVDHVPRRRAAEHRPIAAHARRGRNPAGDGRRGHDDDPDRPPAGVHAAPRSGRRPQMRTAAAARMAAMTTAYTPGATTPVRCSNRSTADSSSGNSRK